MRVMLVGAEFEENLAVRYLRGALEEAGHSVSMVVFNSREDLESAALEVVASRAELVGLSMVFTRRADEFADLATRCRELGFAGHVTAGGHFAAFNAESLLDEVAAIDSVVIGEGEAILCDLASSLDELGDIRGLVFRVPNRKRLKRNASAEKPADLDALPWPVHRRPFDRYLGLPIANMLTSRGCTHACSFCSIAAWHRLCGGERFRLRAVDDVADEMASLYREGVRIFNFHDDNFILGSVNDDIGAAGAARVCVEEARGEGHRLRDQGPARPGRREALRSAQENGPVPGVPRCRGGHCRVAATTR